LRQIKDVVKTSCEYLQGKQCLEALAMSMNMGRIDQYMRIVLGLALVAFAFKDGLAIEGWHWFGLLGFVLLLTAFFRSCPAYSVLGISTCERQDQRS
jgi:hypothetical protein